MANTGSSDRHAHLAGGGRIDLDRPDGEAALAIGDDRAAPNDGVVHAWRSKSTGFFGVLITSPTTAPGHHRSQSACCI